MPTQRPGRLAGSPSPYLAAHAEDPVPWHPWGAEAFELAAAEDRPVFLSVGYASCHWCHVMHRESFEDERIAEELDAWYVPVKVDRELRPDVDRLYMTYVTMAAGRGGWPMTVLLTPSGAPFFGGSYFPPRREGGVPSLHEVLAGMRTTWLVDRAGVERAAAKNLAMLRAVNAAKPPVVPDAADLAAAARRIIGMEDAAHGGIGRAPKFPHWSALGFLIAYGARTEDVDALDMASRWMAALLEGGIYDHADGGVFRYATDEAWAWPHFEKMLYDNAQLLSRIAALQPLRPTRAMERAAARTAAFLDTALARPGGGYWSSLDAETGGVEGATYLWRPSELAATLSREELSLARDTLGIPGGAQDEPFVLARHDGWESPLVDGLLGKLRAERATRRQPPVVANALVEPVALAARGLIEAGETFGEPAMSRRGIAALDVALSAIDAAGGVPHTLDAAAGGVPGFLADHAALATACLAAADHGAEGYLDRASALFERALATFGTPDGPLAMAEDDGVLPVRPIEVEDDPMPSGISHMLELHARLRPDDREGRERMLAPFGRLLIDAPQAVGATLATLARLLPADATR